jgi:NitT/TauT family transport system ATP-binding protein
VTTNIPVTVGFLPLLDCAPLVVAAERGFAAAEGLELVLVRESSWASIRDRVIVGHFDAAHMLAPMPVASTLGLAHLSVPMLAPMALGLGGNAITVSTSLWQMLAANGAALGAGPAQQGAALRAVVADRTRDGLPPLTFGMVYPFSCHNYELRYWLAACGIDPDVDVQLVVMPPPFMADALRLGQLDAFCVGEPWSSLAVESGAGIILATTQSLWRQSPEKVLGLRAAWARRHPERLSALIRAVYRAAAWCEEARNRDDLAELLADSRCVGAPMALLRQILGGELCLSRGTGTVSVPDFWSPSSNAATFPWASHALWFYSQMVRWGQTRYSATAEQTVRSVYRPDLYRAALQPIGVVAPSADMKIERTVHAPGFAAEGFFDGRVFDPQDLPTYIASFG